MNVCVSRIALVLILVMSSQIEFEQIIQSGCGLDIHQKTIATTVPGMDIQMEHTLSEPPLCFISDNVYVLCNKSKATFPCPSGVV